METYATVLSYAIPGFVGLIIIESVVARMMGMQINRGMDTISSILKIPAPRRVITESS